MKSFSALVLAAASATGVMSAAVGNVNNVVTDANTGASFKLNNNVVNSAAYAPFGNVPVVYPVNKAAIDARDQPTEPEPNPDRPDVTPDYVYVLQCDDSGFRGDCLVFGSPPGECVSYFSYDAVNSTDISAKYNEKVISLSTNTGGMCQFYKFKGCDNKGDDRGLSASYNYDLGVPLPDDPRATEYEHQISSWRC
ncbi:hypothetical protein LX36DRAFT_676049 [Colletotrichum falcatum]|nr:hypothetical protein LX36DRAFT_676049 [Colletotrichum falcatum]